MQKQFLILGLLFSLFSISAMADSSLQIGQRVHFKDINSHRVGVVSGFTAHGLILVSAQSHQYHLRSEELGIEVPCLGHICQGNAVAIINHSGYYTGVVDTIYDDRIAWVKIRNANQFIPINQLTLRP